MQYLSYIVWYSKGSVSSRRNGWYPISIEWLCGHQNPYTFIHQNSKKPYQ